jgi:hypothetical protein
MDQFPKMIGSAWPPRQPEESAQIEFAGARAANVKKSIKCRNRR